MSKQKTAQNFEEIRNVNDLYDVSSYESYESNESNESNDNSYSYDRSLVDDIVVSMKDDFDASDEKDDNKSEKEDEKSDDEKDEKDEEIVVLEFDSEKPFSFMMPSVPGALDDSDIVIPEISVEECEEEEAKEIDSWNWQHGGHSKFVPWAQSMINMTPQHSGHDISGLERAIAWILRLIKEFPKALSTDFKGEIDVGSSEELRDSLHAAVGGMSDRMSRILSLKGRKQAGSDNGMIKEAQKATRINGVTITVPLLISGVARTLINGTVSAGHSMEDMYDDLKKKYAFTDREEFEIQLLLSDMGYPVYQDRGRIGEQVNKSRSDNFDWAANYKS